MKLLYLDCSMGAAGDMLTAALTALLPDPNGFIKELNALGIPEVEYHKTPSVKCGITGSRISVTVNGVEECAHEHEHHHEHEHEHYHEHEHEHEHHHEHEHEHGHRHTGMSEIKRILSGLSLPEKVKSDAARVYRIIADAESAVHGVPVEQIHFHEVGNKDAIADVVAVCLLMYRLAPDEVVVSPICTGSGQVKCAHGVLPVPAPATAHILQGMPIYAGEIKCELCTPTGAALIKHFADRFGTMPLMRVSATGYGMGSKDLPAANCVRAMLGETEDREDEAVELSCNIDDMTAEEIGCASALLLQNGAKDVYTVPIGMKKSRPGILLNVICDKADREKMLCLIFKHTSTLGVREHIFRRYILERNTDTLHTKYGEVRRKTSVGYGVKREKYEYDDIVRIAEENGMSLSEARRAVSDWERENDE